MDIDIQSKINEYKNNRIIFTEAKKNEVAFKAWWDDFVIRFCWNSNAIEGNTLSLEETIDVIDYDEVRGGHTYSEYREAVSLHSAIQSKLVPLQTIIDQAWIKDCNSRIMETDGGYRKKPVYIGTLLETIYVPPDFKKIPELMEQYMIDKENVTADNDDLGGFVKKMAENHIEFERIHPFSDGNGRTGRMILNQTLINNDMFPIIILDNSKYRQAFERYDRNKETDLMEYLIIAGEIDAVERFNYFLEITMNSKNIDDKNAR